MYLLSLFFLKSILDFYYALSIDTIFKILIITTISWFPFFLYAKLKAKLFPEEHEKLNLVVSKI